MRFVPGSAEPAAFGAVAALAVGPVGAPSSFLPAPSFLRFLPPRLPLRRRFAAGFPSAPSAAPSAAFSPSSPSSPPSPPTSLPSSPSSASRSSAGRFFVGGSSATCAPTSAAPASASAFGADAPSPPSPPPPPSPASPPAPPPPSSAPMGGASALSASAWAIASPPTTASNSRGAVSTTEPAAPLMAHRPPYPARRAPRSRGAALPPHTHPPTPPKDPPRVSPQAPPLARVAPLPPPALRRPLPPQRPTAPPQRPRALWPPPPPPAKSDANADPVARRIRSHAESHQIESDRTKSQKPRPNELRLELLYNRPANLRTNVSPAGQRQALNATARAATHPRFDRASEPDQTG